MVKDNHLCIGKQFNDLKSLSKQERQTFNEKSKKFHLKKDEVVFFEKERLNKLYTICDGACKFTFTDKEGKEHITKIVGKGDVIGRRAVINNKGTLFTATAISNTTLNSFDKNIFIESLENNNKFCQDVLKGFIMDIDDEAEKISYYQNNRTLKIRLAGLLLYLSKKFGTEQKGWLKVTLKRKDIADILGTTSEYVIALLSKFRDKNYLSLNKNKIKINSNQQLQKLINFK